MNIFDIIGPVMVGPSSSHTAGAVKIGYIARKLMGEEIAEAEIFCMVHFLQQEKDMEQIWHLWQDLWE